MMCSAMFVLAGSIQPFEFGHVGKGCRNKLWPCGRVAVWPGGRVAGWPGGRGRVAVAGWPGGRQLKKAIVDNREVLMGKHLNMVNTW